MLNHLAIQHFILIDKLDLSFDDGLGVFTGETGAGKSILLDALSFALGARSEARFVQKGMDKASVSAAFSLSQDHPVRTLLGEQDLDAEDELILRRVLTSDGKSKAYICDQPVGLSLLKTVGEMLVEIHGQFATHSLLNPATHLITLDAYGQLQQDVTQVKAAWDVWQQAKHKAVVFEQELAAQLAEQDFLKSSLSELKTLKPQENEEESLVERRTVLMNAEKIIDNVKNAVELLNNDEQGILRLLSKASSQLIHANELTQGTFEEKLKNLTSAEEILTDLSFDLEHQLSDLGDTSELPAIDDRLFALRDMARKHHVEIDELPELMVRLEEKLNTVQNGAEQLAQLKKEQEQARLAYLKISEDLSQKRHKTAAALNQAVMAELPQLKLEKAMFEATVTDLPVENATAQGLNQVVFRVATNKGAELMPIHKCASGGELARFMLALKVNLNTYSGKTLIFDEIDTGISGATANAVGERLARLGKETQTLVITHSPQVAGWGNTHYRVSKKDVEQRTLTTVQVLDKGDRLEEIARLVSGENITDHARAVAEELLHG